MVDIDAETTALLLVNPQVDLLTPDSVVWEEIGETVAENDVLDRLVALRTAAETGGVTVVYSHQQFTEAEYRCTVPDTGIGAIMRERRMFDADGRGSEFPAELEPTETTVVCSPHPVLSGFWGSDLDTQLRQRGVDSLVIAGMGANLCVESHLRDAVENGYETVVVTDATAAPGRDALEAAHTNFEFLAHETVTTADVTDRLAGP